jgi:hypothetical protein
MRRDDHSPKTDRIPTNLIMHSAYHNETAGNNSVLPGPRRYAPHDGGFCEVIITSSLFSLLPNIQLLPKNHLKKKILGLTIKNKNNIKIHASGFNFQN